MSMNFKEIQDLIKLINKSNLTEFKMKDGEFELSVRTEKYHRTKRTEQVIAPQAPIVQMPSSIPTAPSFPPPPAPAAPSETAPKAAPQQPQEEEGGNENYLEVKSPMVGTFYRSASPEKPPFVKVGDRVEKGSVVCIVEAMKLFNEIESEISGTIVKVLVEDAQPVEYDQVLFLVDPKG
jgi:acetyl-CoA carboxylase biotin carboxyl carrier protein